MTKISIIIPVYNAEDKIERCIKSVLDQDFQDYEAIFVNDGSSDNSKAILDEYAQKDPRIKVIHKENTGVSDTRNCGLSIAKGQYIQFMDADDWLADNAMRSLSRAMEDNNCDLVVADFYRVVGNNLARKGSISNNVTLSLQEYAQLMMESPADYYYGVLWNKLYRSDIIKNNNILMDKELSFCEDFVFNLEYLLHCKKITTLQIPIYYYVKTEGSLVAQNMNIANIVKMKTSIYEYYDRFYKNILDERKYAKERINIAKYLISAASDDMTIPLLPGTKKLGQENVQLHYKEKGEPTLVDMSYYIRKGYEKYLNTVALKYDLDIKDVIVLNAMNKVKRMESVKQISDYTGLTQTNVLMSIQKLVLHNYITVSFDRFPLDIRINKDAKDILADIDQALIDFYNLCFLNADEDRKTAKEILNKIYKNLYNNLT